MKIALTGASGFLGRWVVKVFSENGFKVRGIDIEGDGDIIQANLAVYSHVKSVLTQIKPDVIIHLAALAGSSGKGGGTESLKNPYDYFKVNALAALNVLEACRELGIRKAEIMSSFSPYGKAVCPITEETPLEPNNPYGGSKQNVETIAKIYAKCYGIKTLIFRVPLICGEGQREMNALREFIGSALKDEPIMIWGDGSTLREWVHPSDVARAYLLGLKYLDKMETPYETFVLGNEPVRMLDLAEEVVSVVGRGGVKLLLDKPKLFDQWTDHSKAKRELGWRSRVSLLKIVEQVVKDMRRT